MEIKEAAERVVIAKPVASKPSCSTFRSFSELLAGATNDSSPPRASCSETVVAAIRPKTVRVAKPAASSASSAAGLLAASCSQSQAGVSRAAAPGQLLDSLLAPDTRSTVVYKPLAKVVSKSTVSLLANMGNFNTSLQQRVPIIEEPQLQELSRPQGLYLRSRQLPEKGAPSVAEPSSRLAEVSRGQPSWQNTEEDQKSLPAVANVDRPSYDGYNWRKYGQKQVKGSEYPRSYYKCTHPNCPVKKKVERSFDGQITEIVYKGEHNHAKPQPPKKNNAPAATAQGNNDQSEGNDQQDFNNVNINTSNNKSSLFLNDASHQNRNAMMRLLSANSAYQASHPILSFDNVVNASLNESTPDNSCGVSGDGSKGIDAGDHHEEPKSKRRKADQVRLSDQAGPSGDGVQQAPKIVVQSSTDTEIVGDGYRWRKYGQKVVKGNPYPRSYYRCTSLECNVRKHVERASEDPNSFITTYEGKHSHEMPAKNANQAASEQGSQSQTNRDRK